MATFKLYDRVKETSRTTGTGAFILDGAALGFDSFDTFYSDGDAFYYAITDGSDYEVGSGLYTVNGSHKTVVRFPIQSTNSNSHVDFQVGVKEVFVTYGASSSLYSAGGFKDNNEPSSSGVGFYSSEQILNYDQNFIWDSGKSSLGLNQIAPTYALDVGGEIDYSVVRSSGFIDGGSGVLFSGVAGSFSGGRQLEPFLRNELNNETGSDAILELSGVVDQGIMLKKQVAKSVFMGPIDDWCGSPPCDPDYPTFRILTSTDLPSDIVDDNGSLKLPIAVLDTAGPPVELKDKTTNQRIDRNTGIVVIYESVTPQFSGIAFCNSDNVWMTTSSSFVPIS